jgi:transcriptional regulator with XRE-family HTH domain
MERDDNNKEMLQTCFGKVLRQLRTNIGISQEKLALDVGLDRTYISLMERGLRMPTLYTIFLLAGRLDTSVTEIASKVEDLYNS